MAALVLAAATAREGQRGAAAAAAVAGIATLAWPAAGIRLSVELADQVLIGLAWIALGVLIRQALSRRPTSPGEFPDLVDDIERGHGGTACIVMQTTAAPCNVLLWPR